MKKYIVTNDIIELVICSKGAEIKSLRRLSDDTEYMWQGDPKFWKRTSPVLFPFVGTPKNKEYMHEGVTFPMGQHGFARDMEFSLFSQTSQEIWFCLHDNEETYKVYPFHFELMVGYKIEGSAVTVMWKVKNPDEATLYFAIGAHPAFHFPLHEGEDKLDYSLLLMDGEGNPISSFDDKGIAFAGLAETQYVTKQTSNGILRITENTFEKDTLIIEKDQIKKVSLLDSKKQVYLTVSFDAPLGGIWSPCLEAPFICIEPWYGRCDAVDFEGEIKDKDYINQLSKGEVFEAAYQIEV